jgi:hypothetical protein
MKARKTFFFEKKKQKTFALAPAERYRPWPAKVGAVEN